MKAEEKKLVSDFENRHGYQMMMMSIAYYIDKGEHIIKTITNEDIEKVRANGKDEEREAAKRGKIRLIDPDYEADIVRTAKELYDLPKDVRYYLIKKYL